MTSARVLALMALMNEIQAPSATYHRAVSRAAQTFTGSTENNRAQARGNAALLEIEKTIRAWVAKHPVPDAPDGPALDGALRIVNDWCIEANEVGGVDAGDLVFRLEQAGYPLPDDEQP